MNTVAKRAREGQAARENVAPERSYLAPEVNIMETTEEYRLEAEMPGVNKDGLEITLEGNILTLVGHQTFQFPQADLLYRESRSVDFRRSFELAPTIDTQKINAQMGQGILTLHLPKTEQVKPRKIPITD